MFVHPTVFYIEKFTSLPPKAEHINNPLNEVEQGVLSMLLGEEVTIERTPRGAPSLKLSDGSFRSLSISHTTSHLAVLVAPYSLSVGVDIENYRHKVIRVAERYMYPDELTMLEACVTYSQKLRLATQIWCCKEALYKALAPINPSVDFRRCYKALAFTNRAVVMAYMPTYNFTNQPFLLHCNVTADYCLAYCVLPRVALLE